MADKGGSGNGNADASKPNSGGYVVTSSGINSKGNHYCNRDYGPNVINPNAYHYSNRDGSYYYSNPNGSTYYNDGAGYYWYNRGK